MWYGVSIEMKGPPTVRTNKKLTFRIHHALMGVYISFDKLEDAVHSLSSPKLVMPEDYEIREVTAGRRVATYSREGLAI